MNRRTFSRILLISNFILFNIACNRPTNSPTQGNYKNLEGPVSKLISTRPEKSGPVKLIIRLPADPLAKVSKEDWADQLALIQDQQKNLTTQLNTISKDIKIIYTYKILLNGLYVVIPEDQASKVDAIIPEGSHVELSTAIRRPEAQVESNENGDFGDLKAHNSVKFIGADQLHAQGIKGQGTRVGIIDTGIDYTHSMLGGTGSSEDYKKIDPSKPSPLFPNSKVVGGYDFVGKEYDSAAANPLTRIPIPDENPLDEAGHGSHVAGTVAGIGNGTESYDGVAPEALLYALKVFGKDGSTDDAIVIAALEFAADPDSNLETNNPLDVVNLSLGSPFGNPKLLYKEAISNLNFLGTIVVASAGNSGDVSYITGSPAVSDEALSVAASIDDMEHNWHFATAIFKLSDDNEITTEATEATFTKELKGIEKMTGKLVYVGLGNNITEEQSNLLKGNIALIDRGVIAFTEKVKNAVNAGATGVVVINNVEGDPFTMGGNDEEDAKIEIPAIMIGLTHGKIIKEAVTKGTDVIANLKSDKKVAKPELIDTLTSFSSRGPRSEDSIIKPEISAPGSNIISAKVGGGSKVESMSGTSMAAPHMAGVMALLKQTHSSLSPQQLKSLAMLTSKSINDKKGVIYPIALQGAGRVQMVQANQAGITMEPASISLGRNEVLASKTISKKIKIKNLESKDITLSVEAKLNPNLILLSPTSINLKGNQESVIDFQVKVKAPDSKKFDNELDGFLLFTDQDKKTYSIPVLSMSLKISQLSAESLKIHSSSEEDSTGSLSQLKLKNISPHSGSAFLFNLLGKDELKDDHGVNKRNLSTACDLESAGFRTITVEDEKGIKTELLQMALKLYNPLTSWSNCEFSVQIDSNNDGIADQELAGGNRSNTEGLGSGMASFLMDANKARAIRKEYEEKIANKKPKDKKVVLDFSPAVESLMKVVAINQSTLMIIQTPVSGLKTIPGQNLKVKVGALNIETDIIEGNDFLGQSWLEMPLNAQAQTVTDIPQVITMDTKSEINVQLTKGEGKNPLIMYFPHNHASMTSAGDLQSQVIQQVYVENEQ